MWCTAQAHLYLVLMLISTAVERNTKAAYIRKVYGRVVVKSDHSATKECLAVLVTLVTAHTTRTAGRAYISQKALTGRACVAVYICYSPFPLPTCVERESIDRSHSW